MEKLEVHPDIPVAQWSDWHAWSSLCIRKGDEGCAPVPDVPGVYEVRRKGQPDRIDIGMTEDSLNSRLRRALVKGTHSAGKRFRDSQDLSVLEVRWCPTRKAREVEAYLKGKHVAEFGRLPTYTRQ